MREQLKISYINLPKQFGYAKRKDGEKVYFHFDEWPQSCVKKFARRDLKKGTTFEAEVVKVNQQQTRAPSRRAKKVHKAINCVPLPDDSGKDDLIDSHGP